MAFVFSSCKYSNAVWSNQEIFTASIHLFIYLHRQACLLFKYVYAIHICDLVCLCVLKMLGSLWT